MIRKVASRDSALLESGYRGLDSTIIAQCVELGSAPLTGISHEMEGYRVQCVCSPTHHDQPADNCEAEGPKIGRKYYLTSRCDSSANVSMDAERGTSRACPARVH